MNMEQFLIAFSKIAGDFRLNERGEIRTSLSCLCPIERISNNHSHGVHISADVLGLSEKDKWIIILAADNNPDDDSFDPEEIFNIRKTLLGMMEQ